MLPAMDRFARRLAHLPNGEEYTNTRYHPKHSINDSVAGGEGDKGHYSNAKPVAGRTHPHAKRLSTKLIYTK